MTREQSDNVQLALRTKEAMRAKLEEAARGNGQSINREIIARLEQSFAHERWIEDVFGSMDAFAVARAQFTAMDAAARTAGRFMGKHSPDWLNDPALFDQAVLAARTVLEALRPPAADQAEIDKSEGDLDLLEALLGATVARALLFDSTPNIKDQQRIYQALRPALRERLRKEETRRRGVDLMEQQA